MMNQWKLKTALTSPIYIEQEATMVIPTTRQVIALHQEEEGEMQNLGQKSRMQGIMLSLLLCIGNDFSY